MLINSKSSLVYNALQDKIKKGSRNIEVQLLDELLNDLSKKPEEYICKEIINDIQNNKYRINVIHMPLWDGEDFDIEDNESWPILLKVAEIARFLADIQHQPILIVVHTSENISKLKSYDRIYQIKKMVLEILDKNPCIEIAFENTLNIYFNNKKQRLEMRRAFDIDGGKITFSNIELAKEINHPRCGVVLDTCHAIMGQNFIDMINQFLQGKLIEINMLDELFSQSKDYIKLIHLNYTKLNGFDELHGLPFSRDNGNSLTKLQEILDLYQKYNYNCMITIEVKEDDYLNSKNYGETLESLKYLLSFEKNRKIQI